MLHDLAKLPHLTISIKLVDRRRKHHSQANHLVRPNQSSAYMPISGLDTRGVTPELKLRLKFYCSWTWWVFLLLFFSCWLCLFVCFIVSFLFLFLFSFFFLYYQLYHHHLLIAPVISFTLLPSPVLKSIALQLNYSFCLFLPTLSPCLHLPHPLTPNLSPDYISLLHTHHLLTNLLYQLYTTTTPCNPWHKNLHYNNRNILNTHRSQNPAAPTLLPYSPIPLPTSPSSATLTNSPNIYS
jgi:hypothetical protein